MLTISCSARARSCSSVSLGYWLRRASMASISTRDHPTNERSPQCSVRWLAGPVTIPATFCSADWLSRVSVPRLVLGFRLDDVDIHPLGKDKLCGLQREESLAN